MRIPRIYIDAKLEVDQTVVLNGDAVNHLANVLRLKANHPIVLFNGDNNEYSAVLTDINKRQATAMVDACLAMSVETPLGIHLGQGISRGDRMDFVLQKSVELGVSEITPLITERCGVKLSSERWQKKHQQWLKIIIGACEQSGRNTIPTLHMPMPFEQWIQQATQQTRLTLHPRAEKRLTDIAPTPYGFRLLIGPEGGLSDKEIYQTQEFGYIESLLGPRVLRTETAALTALAVLQSRFGDL